MLVLDPETADGERVKIFDFGIAKLRLTSLAQATGPTALRTRTGMIMGTPTHMAPEQCRGAKTVDGKADVYSLGIILFQTLVGHPPFYADNAGELMTMHMRDTPPSLRKLDPTIPKDLANLVHTMLAKEARERPAMNEVCDRLVALAAGRPRRNTEPQPEVPVATPTGASAERLRARPAAPRQAVGQDLTPASTQPFAIPIAVALVLVVVSGALLFDWRLPSFSHPRQSTQLPAQPRELIARPAEPLAALGAVLEPAVPAVELRDPPTPPPVHGPPLPDPVPLPVKRPVGPHLRWQIASRPPGATVVREEDGQLLGTTPFTYEQPAQDGILRLTLRLAGHQDAGVVLDLTSGSKQTITLPATTPGSQSGSYRDASRQGKLAGDR